MLECTKQTVENTFDRFTRDGKDSEIAVVLVTQETSEKFLREKINNFKELSPVILEIPSKEKPYDPVKDVVMQRAHRLLYGSEMAAENNLW